MGTTVLIVDDHAGFRASASALLQADGFEVVGNAATGAEAVAQTRRLSPQLVLLDIGLPDLDGISVAGQLAGLDAPPEVVLISSRESATYGTRLGEASGKGFLAKAELSGPALRLLLA